MVRFSRVMTVLTYLGVVSGWTPLVFAQGQTYPVKPVRIVVPFTPGSGSDILARAVSQKISASWKQPVVVDNRPGAGGTIGTAIVAKAPPDGHSLIVVSVGHVVNPAIYKILPYDTLRDFSGVVPLANLPSVLAVSKDSRVATVRELIALAKSKAGNINYVSGGIGSGSHVNAEKFKAVTGISSTHIPLKGAADMLTELMAGRVEYGFLPIIAAVPTIKDGRVVAIAVSTNRRSSVLPNIPTIGEAGFPAAEFDFWIGVLAPAATPRPIVKEVNEEISKALKLPDVSARLAALGAEPMPMSAEEFDSFMRKEAVSLAEVMKAAGVKPE